MTCSCGRSYEVGGDPYRGRDCTALVRAADAALDVYRAAKAIPGFPTARLRRDYLAARAAAERCLGRQLPRAEFPDHEVSYEVPDTGRLYGKLMNVLRRLPPDRRVAVFQRWADQMYRRAGWEAQRGRLADQGTSFTNKTGEAIVFDPAGTMWRGNVTNPAQFAVTSKGLRPNYGGLRRIG